MPFQTHLFIDPNTLAVSARRCKRCIGCKKIVLASNFHRAVRGKVTSRCKACYSTYHAEKNEKMRSLPLRDRIELSVNRANRRSRLRKSVGPPLNVDDAVAKWTGKCSNCDHDLTFDWWPRQPNDDLAIIDRVSTRENRSYHQNFTWLCNACNSEKGGFDLCEQKDREIEVLQRKLSQARKRAREESIPYASILHPV